MAIHPIILSGGSGTRLWPLSRSMYPKQFIRLLDGQGPTFLGATLRRLRPDAGFAAPTLISNNDHRFLVREELEQANRRVPTRSSWSRSRAIRRRPLRSRHWLSWRRIRTAFWSSCRRTTPFRMKRASSRRYVWRPSVAAHGKLVLFGIKPTSTAHRIRLHPAGDGARRIQWPGLHCRCLRRKTRCGHGATLSR